MNGDYTVAIWATIGLTVLFTVPVVWQFLQPNDDDFGDITKRPKGRQDQLSAGDRQSKSLSWNCSATLSN